MINKITLLGRVGKDVEIRTTQSGVQVATFSMATAEKYKDKEHTEWHKLVAFERTAEIASKYVRKGDMLYVEGKVQTRTYEKQDGTKGHSFDIIIQKLVLLPNGKKEAQTTSVQTTDEQITQDEELPF